mmetsp:Transcript_16125/g.21324  ORF Transcript_16125/g.21324 Transcript_16125/m.21324 type:complete len:88 (+) Transcript_16125:1287-1550(+)
MDKSADVRNNHTLFNELDKNGRRILTVHLIGRCWGASINEVLNRWFSSCMVSLRILLAEEHFLVLGISLARRMVERFVSDKMGEKMD